MRLYIHRKGDNVRRKLGIVIKNISEFYYGLFEIMSSNKPFSYKPKTRVNKNEIIYHYILYDKYLSDILWLKFNLVKTKDVKHTQYWVNIIYNPIHIAAIYDKFSEEMCSDVSRLILRILANLY
jgi:hypothetical protein